MNEFHRQHTRGTRPAVSQPAIHSQPLMENVIKVECSKHSGWKIMEQRRRNTYKNCLTFPAIREPDLCSFTAGRQASDDLFTNENQRILVQECHVANSTIINLDCNFFSFFGFLFL